MITPEVLIALISAVGGIGAALAYSRTEAGVNILYERIAVLELKVSRLEEK